MYLDVCCFLMYFDVCCFSDIPHVGQYIKAPFQKAVQAQKDKLHQTGSQTVEVRINITCLLEGLDLYGWGRGVLGGGGGGGDVCNETTFYICLAR